MVLILVLPHAEIGPNDHREDASHFIQSLISKTLSKEATLPFIDSNTCARQVQAISQVKKSGPQLGPEVMDHKFWSITWTGR